MERLWTALIAAGVLAVTLTACGEGTSTNGPTEGRRYVGGEQIQSSQTRRAGENRISRYQEDARYQAGADGQIRDRIGSTTRDLTEDARDMIRDAENAVKNAGKDVRDTVKDMEKN